MPPKEEVKHPEHTALGDNEQKQPKFSLIGAGSKYADPTTDRSQLSASNGSSRSASHHSITVLSDRKDERKEEPRPEQAPEVFFKQ